MQMMNNWELWKLDWNFDQNAIEEYKAITWHEI